MNKQDLARFGEKVAAKYLQQKGYKILEKNFHSRYGEIDIVAVEKDTLVFVEVKTRFSDRYGKPEDAITKRKLKLIAVTGHFFKMVHQNLPDLLRIDAVLLEVNSNGSVKRLELVKDAFIN